MFCKNQGGVKTSVGSELNLVSGKYYENKVSVVMEMASFFIKIRPLNYITWKADSSSKSEAKHGGN
jgi:hypothetical protein